MANFRADDDGILVADQHGDLTYHEARSLAVTDCLEAIESAVWGLVDDIEYIADAEADDPSDPKETA